MRGAEAVARDLLGPSPGRAGPRSWAAPSGLVMAQQGEARMVFDFTIEDGKVVEIDLIADPERIRELEPTHPGRLRRSGWPRHSRSERGTGRPDAGRPVR